MDASRESVVILRVMSERFQTLPSLRRAHVGVAPFLLVRCRPLQIGHRGMPRGTFEPGFAL